MIHPIKFLVTVGASVSVGCALLSGVGDLEKVACVNCEGGEASGAANDPSLLTEGGPSDSGGDADSEVSDESDAQGSDSDAPENDCPGTAGPKPVRLNGFCIDSTEVTNTHYAEFLAAKGGDSSGQIPACEWNTSYTPKAAWPPAPGDLDFPVVNVDWCDAYAYCKWAGKRLCGRVGGGPGSDKTYASADLSQWHYACTNGGVQTYPYGDVYDETACNSSSNNGKMRPVATMPKCVGGASNAIFDMVGNAWEFEDICDGETGAFDHCAMRGGGFGNLGPDLKCAYIYFDHRNYYDSDLSIRCCSP